METESLPWKRIAKVYADENRKLRRVVDISANANKRMRRDIYTLCEIFSSEHEHWNERKTHHLVDSILKVLEVS